MQLLLQQGVPVANDAVILRTAAGIPYVIDRSALALVANYKWHARKSRSGYYLWRTKTVKGKTRYISMHRWLLHAEKGQEVHHRNGRTLDNRLDNLMLMTPAEHNQLHKIKYFKAATLGSRSQVQPSCTCLKLKLLRITHATTQPMPNSFYD
jgi:hypothetical protein